MNIPEVGSIWIFKASNPNHRSHKPTMTYRPAQITEVVKNKEAWKIAYGIEYEIRYELINSDGSRSRMRSYLKEFLISYSLDLDQHEYIL